ncbi:MAG TPA: hypothetical protein EYQ00_15695 [Dehalococcoidia bacterium]|nr:hypothetical protein [Dehalococcoidia bacterium]
MLWRIRAIRLIFNEITCRCYR